MKAADVLRIAADLGPDLIELHQALGSNTTRTRQKLRAMKRAALEAARAIDRVAIAEKHRGRR